MVLSFLKSICRAITETKARRIIQRGFAAGAIAVGTITLIGYAINYSRLTMPVPNTTNVAPPTAIGLICLGVAVMLGGSSRIVALEARVKRMEEIFAKIAEKDK